MRHWKQSRLSLTQKTEIWSRWKSGQSLHEIGRAFGKPSSCIHCLLVPLATCHRQRTVTGSDCRCHLDPRKAGSGRSSSPWPLGRRSAEWRKEQLHGDPGRASFALCHADQSAQQRHRSCRCCIEPARSLASRYPATLANRGSRTGDGQAQGFHGSDGR